MTQRNRQWVVARASTSPAMCLEPEVFGIRETDVPAPADGQILIRNQFFACEPLVHAWVKGVPGRIPPIPVGGCFKGHAGGRVIASRHPDFRVGDGVHGNLDWADYVLSNGTDANGVALSRQVPGFGLPTSMISLGMTGLCAYIGLFDLGRPQPGDVVAVSAAAGGIGTIAGQLAKLAGCTAIGIAGGADKCRWLVDEVGFDAAVDYKTGETAQRLAQLAPAGINVYFDNVGGSTLDAVLVNLAPWGRIAICGGIGSYDNPAMGVYSTILLAQRNGSMQGFWYSDYAHRFPDMTRRLGRWLKEGRIKEMIDLTQGFEQVPDATRGIFSGTNRGKRLVQIAADSAV